MALSNNFDVCIPSDADSYRGRIASLHAARLAVETAAMAGACLELEELFGLHPEIVRARLRADHTGTPRFKAWAQALDGSLCDLELLADCPSLHTMSDIDWRVFGATHNDKLTLSSFRAMPARPWLAMHSKARSIFDRLAALAPTASRELAGKTAQLSGPDAASFARQMDQPDLAALIEASLIEAASHHGPASARQTPSL